MTLVTPPLVVLNLPVGPLTNITPFTHRNGMTYLEILEGLKCYITDLLVPDVDGKFRDATDFINDAIQAQTDLVNGAVETVVNNSIVLQDPVLAALINDVSSISRIAFNQLLANIISEDVDDPGTFIIQQPELPGENGVLADPNDPGFFI